MQQYLLVADRRFLKHALGELADIAESARKINQRYIGASLTLVSLESEPQALLHRIRQARPTFIYGVIPVAEVFDGLGEDATVLTAHLSKLLDSSETFRIEVIKVGTTIEPNAKSIEVSIGKPLEEAGYKPDLSGPDVIVYLVLERSRAIIGLAHRADLYDSVIDHFRLENRATNRVNRAETKLKEAFDVFGLLDKQLGICLDIGAAPGGWTDFLAKRGSKVVAVDKAQLDYGKITGKKIVVEEFKRESKEAPDMTNTDVLHLKYNIRSISELPFAGPTFDLVAIDINTEPLKSAAIAVEAAALLKDGGYLIMAVKLQDARDIKIIREAEKTLSKVYSEVRANKLHHNRLEVTLFGRKAAD
jgi:23S rRNA C2498 (ribose-2'-O)-methylase RlmM